MPPDRMDSIADFQYKPAARFALGAERQAQVILTPAEIITSGSSPVVLIPAPGPNLILQLKWASAVFVPGTRRYGGGGATHSFVYLGATQVADFDAAEVSDTADWWQVARVPSGSRAVAADLADVVDAPLLLQASADSLSGLPLATSIDTAGVDYLAGDILADPTDGSFTIRVLTVSGLGAVLTYEVLTVGNNLYAPSDTIAMTGGTGSGFVLTVDTVSPGNGILTVFLGYSILDLKGLA